MPVPSKERVIELLVDVMSGEGYDLEDVAITNAGKYSAVRVTIDRDAGLELDSVAELSRKISEVFDAVDDFGETPYTLEVGTPGIERPLSLERHWRRARGRKVRLEVGDEKFDARVGPLVGDSVTIVTRNAGVLATRLVKLDAIESAVVQVEFARPGQAEMDLAGGIIEGRPQPADTSAADTSAADTNADMEEISTHDEGSDT